MRQLLLLFVFSFSLILAEAQDGNATITMVDIKVGRKHTNILSLTFGQIQDFHTKKALYNFDGNKIYKGKRQEEHLYTINVEKLREGSGTITRASDGEVILSTRDGEMYFGDITSGDASNVATLAFKVGEYNEKKMQQFFLSELDGKPTASYKGRQLNDKEEILIMLALAERFYSRNFAE